MAVRQLPRRPSLEYLRNESRDLQRGARRGDPEALAFLAEHVPSSTAHTLASVQLGVARSYGFASWPKLREHVETINRYFWPPDEGESDDEDRDLVERFLTDACLTYTGVDAGQRPRDAAALLDAHPEIASASVHAMAAANEADALRSAVASDPTLVEQPGGPHRWVPLLYAAYARVPGRSTLEAARVLLDAGADPNAGSLWRLLLDRGVDPNGTSHYRAEDGRSLAELAELAGNRAIAELLVAAGAEPRTLDPLERFVAACMRAAKAEVEAARTDELVRRAEQGHAPLSAAAALGRRDAVHLMLDVGFDINALGRDAGATGAGHGGSAP